MCRLVTKKFVILVPDPVGVSSSWSLRGGARVTSGLTARQIEELEKRFATGSALQLSLFQERADWLPCALCRAADVQRSGPGKGRRAHEAV